MSLKYVANTDFSLLLTPQPGSTVVPGKLTAGKDDVDYTEKTAVRACEKPVCVDTISKSDVSSAYGCLPTAPGDPEWVTAGSFTINSSAVSARVAGKNCMLAGDFAMCACSGTVVQGQSSTPFAGACKVEISDAGQDKVRAQ